MPFSATLGGAYLPPYMRLTLGGQSDTLKRAVLTATLPVLNVTEITSLTGSSSASMGVPAASPNDIPLLAAMVRVPSLVGTVVAPLSTVTSDIVSAESAHVTVALAMVSALVSIGPKSAYRTSVSSTCLHRVPSKSTHVVVIGQPPDSPLHTD